MFTLEQVREFTQKIDDYVNDSKDQNSAIKTLLPQIEEVFSDLFQKDELSNTGKQWFTFRISEAYYGLLFESMNTSTLRMFCINLFTERTDSGGMHQIDWGTRTPAHEFIYYNCNPQGVLMLEKILFEEII